MATARSTESPPKSSTTVQAIETATLALLEAIRQGEGYLGEQEAKAESIRQDIARLEAERERTHAATTTKIKELDAATAELTKATAAVHETQATLTTLQAEEAALKTRIEALKGELTAVRGEVAATAKR